MNNNTFPTVANIIEENAKKNNQVTILYNLLKKANLLDALQTTPNLTLFAPSDAAFKNVDSKTLEFLQSPEGAQKLKEILLYHVLPTKVLSKDINITATPVTLQGKNLCIYKKDGKVNVNDGFVYAADLQGTNGVVHVINTVLTPLESCMKYGL